MMQGGFYTPSSRERISYILSLANVKPGEKVVDLGSGDGRVLMACAKKGARCTGFEIDPLLVWRSRKNIKKAHLDKKITIIPKSFWTANISSYDVIIIYGITHIMGRLKDKLKKEAKENTRIISVYFRFPGWDHILKKGDIYLYKV
jgi:cyclopropane fatty-acyl-phospholipid synthase-like methyltransferase